MRFYTKKRRIRQKLSQLQINLPESTSAAPSAAAPVKKNIILQIKSADSVTLDNKPIALDDLAEAIEEAQETYPDCKITMQADKDAPFGAVVKVLDALQTAGIKNIPTMTRTSTTH